MAGPLSLGITSTFQLILAESTYPVDIRDSQCNETYATDLVRRTLSERITVPCATCGELYSFKASPDDWKVEVDEKTTPSEDEVASLGANVNHVQFHGVIITTPSTSSCGKQVMQADLSKHVHSISRKVEIQAVLMHLQSRLVTLQLGSDRWLFASKNCRVSTSVSSNGNTFPLSTAKKVAFIMTAWQRLFDVICEPHCITTEALFNDHIGVYLDEWLTKIKKAPGFNSLVALLHGTKNAGILDVEDVAAGGSFRFSQQAGTLDPKQIFAWQDVCEKIVLRAHAAEGTYFAWQFSADGEYRAPSFGLRDMLRELGVKNSTVKFFEKRHVSVTPDGDAPIARELNSMKNVLVALAMFKRNAQAGTARQTAVRQIVLAKLKPGAYGRVHMIFVEAAQAVS